MVQKLEHNPQVEKALHVLPDKISKIEDRVSTQAAYALITLLGPFGEPIEAVMDAARDAKPSLDIVQNTLAVTIPILEEAKAAGKNLTLDGAAQQALPIIAQSLEAKDPAAAEMVESLHNAPALTQKLGKLAAVGTLTDAKGVLTDTAVETINDHVHEHVKKYADAAQHGKQLAEGREQLSAKPRPTAATPTAATTARAATAATTPTAATPTATPTAATTATPTPRIGTRQTRRQQARGSVRRRGSTRTRRKKTGGQKTPSSSRRRALALKNRRTRCRTRRR